MADYQHVNPYEMMYRNMNFEINEHITRETAEKVARQLGFMHNAFGVIAKDLIKILSFKFETSTTHPHKPQRTIYRV